MACGPADGRLVSRRRLHRLQYEAARMRERSVLLSLALVLAANLAVFWLLGSAALDGRLSLGSLVAYATAAAGTSMIAFGGLNWALDGAAAPVTAVGRLRAAMGQAGTIESGQASADGMPARQVTFRDVTFANPPSPDRPVLRGLNLEIPASPSTAVVTPFSETYRDREIAQRLYLSHRTVSSRLYRIFPKLGITSRAQLRSAMISVDARPVAGAP